MNTSNLNNELISVGLSIFGCDSSGNVQLLEPDTNNLVPLVLAAHEQPLNSTECLALQAAITNEQWLAYQDCRKAPIRSLREQRYRAETDALFMVACEDSTIGDSNWLAAIESWRTAKENIRTELPYEE